MLIVSQMAIRMSIQAISELREQHRLLKFKQCLVQLLQTQARADSVCANLPVASLGQEELLQEGPGVGIRNELLAHLASLVQIQKSC